MRLPYPPSIILILLSQDKASTCWRCVMSWFSVSIINRVNSALDVANKILLWRWVNWIAISTGRVIVQISEQIGCKAQFILVYQDVVRRMTREGFYTRDDERIAIGCRWYGGYACGNGGMCVMRWRHASVMSWQMLRSSLETSYWLRVLRSRAKMKSNFWTISWLGGKR